MIIFAKKICNLTLLIITTIFINGTIAQKTNAQENESPTVQQEATTIEVDRQSLCEKFPQNSNCKKEPPQVLKIQLDSVGEDREWIRIDKNRNTVKILYTEQVKNAFVSGLFNAALSFIPAPIPFSEALTPREWSDRTTTRVAFKPDRCSPTAPKSSQPSLSSCTITGTDSLILPEGTNIRAGLFTVEYTEGELLRSVTFRIPSDAKIELARTVTFTIPQTPEKRDR
jgi:hypothetical protein